MFSRVFLLSLFALSLTACGGSDDSSVTAALDVTGEWLSDCVMDDSDPDDVEYSVTRYTFIAGKYQVSAALFSDAECQNELMQFELAGLYSVGKTLTTDTGLEAYELDVTVDDVSMNGASVPVTIDSYADIVRIEQGYMYLGDDDSVAEGERPTALDFDVALQKQN